MPEAREPDPRVYFAAERTFLAWIRTGLALMGFGFVVAKFGVPTHYSQWIGVALIGIGVALTAGAATMHVKTIHRLNRGEPFVGRPTGLGIVLAVLLIGIGALMILYLGSTVVAGAPASAGASARLTQRAAQEQIDALAEAARAGNAAAVAKLLDAGVDVNTKYRYDVTALSFACDRGHLAVVKLLLERGADVNIKDTFYGVTALYRAASPSMGRKPEHAEIVGLLLKRGATGKENAFVEAVTEGDAAMTKVILEVGGLSAEILSDALELTKAESKPAVAAVLESAGVKVGTTTTLTAAQLDRYKGTYKNPAGTTTVVISVADGHLVYQVTQPIALAARSETVFSIPAQPGFRLTFTLENGKAVSFKTPTTVYARTGDQ